MQSSIALIILQIRIGPQFQQLSHSNIITQNAAQHKWGTFLIICSAINIHSDFDQYFDYLEVFETSTYCG